ncbi:MAG: hypothetical protein DI617_05245 [Streptococcus pyogenes]|uniref:tyrosine-type recombinase/integrase n=1 Tax=Streptococcus halichoeri TaxID=254785 RepID=UPI000DB38F1A|nr:site-specific integrase [Streptococcus halichoeri]PZO94941.1 MAG: hypothetical protein DI617_05245 [Streptococcus pyogenes]
MKITEYKKKNGTIVYRASVYLGVDRVTGKKARTSVSGRTKKELKNNIKLAKYEFQANGQTASKKVQVKTFKDLTDMWLINYKMTLKPQSYNSMVSMLNKHILPYFGKMTLDKITSSDVQTFINDLSKKTINYVNARSITNRILQHGILLQLIQYNPARDIVLPRKYFHTFVRQSALDRVCREAGIPRFTFHAFRHTHASFLLNAGISYKELQYRLGHATLAMTLDVYSHLSKDKEKEAVSFFEKAINSI